MKIEMKNLIVAVTVLKWNYFCQIILKNLFEQTNDWTALSPDLTPMDYFEWEKLENYVYSYNAHSNVDDSKWKAGSELIFRIPWKVFLT